MLFILGLNRSYLLSNNKAILVIFFTNLLIFLVNIFSFISQQFILKLPVVNLKCGIQKVDATGKTYL